jgi:hypothetical protein
VLYYFGIQISFKMRFEYFSTHAQLCCASANPCQVQNLGLPAPVARQVQKLVGLLRQIISAKALQCQDKIFDIAAIAKVLYNYYINRR